MLAGDYKEGYYMGTEIPADDPRAEKQFYGENLWPAEGNLIRIIIHNGTFWRVNTDIDC